MYRRYLAESRLQNGPGSSRAMGTRTSISVPQRTFVCSPVLNNAPSTMSREPRMTPEEVERITEELRQRVLNATIIPLNEYQPSTVETEPDSVTEAPQPSAPEESDVIDIDPPNDRISNRSFQISESNDEAMERAIEDIRQRVINANVVPSFYEVLAEARINDRSNSINSQPNNDYQTDDETDILNRIFYDTSVFDIPIHNQYANAEDDQVSFRRGPAPIFHFHVPMEHGNERGLIPMQFMNPSSRFLDLPKKDGLPSYDEVMARDDFQLPSYEEVNVSRVPS